MEKNFRINPVGLKGNEINERMKQLMGVTPIVENLSRSAVELTKIGPDGKSYGIIRENHEYYIKVSDKTSNVITEDFKYIGGLQNKKQEAYPTYAKAIKHLNLKFNSICESYDVTNTFNVYVDDNLLTEGAAKEATKHITDTKGTDLGGKVKEEGGDNLADKKAIDEMEEVTLTEDELAIDAMLNEVEEIDEEESKDNPWAICTASVGREDKKKYEACVRDIKKEKGIKEVEGKMTDKQKKFAALAEPKDKITYADKIAGATKSKTNENFDNENMSTDELMDRLDNMSAKELLQLLGDAGRDLKSVIARKLSTGMDKARTTLNKMYPEGDEPMSPKDKKFAALAEPKDKITYADKIAGATKDDTMNEDRPSFGGQFKQFGNITKYVGHEVNFHIEPKNDKFEVTMHGTGFPNGKVLGNFDNIDSAKDFIVKQDVDYSKNNNSGSRQGMMSSRQGMMGSRQGMMSISDNPRSMDEDMTLEEIQEALLDLKKKI